MMLYEFVIRAVLVMCFTLVMFACLTGITFVARVVSLARALYRECPKQGEMLTPKEAVYIAFWITMGRDPITVCDTINERRAQHTKE